MGSTIKIDFSNIFSGLVPEVNYAKILSEENANIETLTNLLFFGILTETNKGIEILTKLGFTLDDKGNFVAPKLKSTITLDTAQTIRSIPVSPFNTLDDSDSNDYENRYTSLDGKVYEQDGTDIAFFRIVELDTRKPVFPNNTLSTPGITETKFKQFILTQLSMQHNERMQIVETNKDYQALFFNKKPEMLQIAGVLKNTVENPWSVNMLFLWDDYMRGTQLAAKGRICQLYADGEFYEGYPFNFSRSKVAGNDILVNFSFTFLIKTRTVIR